MGKVYVPILTIVDGHTAFCPSYSLAAIWFLYKKHAE